MRHLHLVPFEGSRKNRRHQEDQVGALSTENEAGTQAILGGTRLDSSEDAKQSWHDVAGPSSFASVVQDENASRSRQPTMSLSSSIVRKLGIWDWF